MVNLGRIKTGVSYKKVIVAFFVVAILLAVFITYATLSQATVIIHPFNVEKEVGLEVNIDKNAPKVNFGTKTLPGKLISRESEDEKTGQVSQRDVPAFAKGKVTIYNKRGASQPLLKGTHLRAGSAKLADGNPVYFLIDERAVVPANGSVEVSVTSEFKGKENNLEPGRLIIDRLHQSAWEMIYAENKETFQGGAVKATVVLEEDIENAKNELKEKIREDLLGKINAELPEEEKIEKQNTTVEILDFSSSAKPEEEVNEYKVKMKARVTAFVYSREDLLGMAVDKLGETQAPEQEYKGFDDKSFSMEVLELNINEGRAKVKVNLKGLFDVKLSQKVFEKESLIGKTQEEIAKYYEQFDNIESIEIIFWPFWVKTVPSWVNNIHIEVE
jgi:hypothetical protein